MRDKLNGIPLYQLMEIHRHIQMLKELFPVLDPQNAILPGAHSPSRLRETLGHLEDEGLTDFARAVAGLIGCDRVVGMAEVKLVAVGDIDEIARTETEDGS